MGAAAGQQRIVDRLLDELEAGRRPERESLRAEFPDHTETIDRLLSAFAAYRKLADGLKRTRGDPSGRLQPGALLGDFEIDSFLSGGGMGDVYRARQRSLGGRLVALKLIREDLTAAPDGERVRARFQREALASSKLHHPHLAEVFGFGQQDGQFFYAMRLVHGPTLHQVLEQLARARSESRSESLNGSQTRWIVERVFEVASALDMVHRAGLVHRDVKASNILLDGAGLEPAIDSPCSAVLVDFGLVQSVDPGLLTRTLHNAATQAYAPPEILLGQPADARADVFSLGVTLHDLLSRRLPKERDRAAAGLEPISELAPGLSPDLCAIVSKAADPEARYRYPDGGAFAADLKAWLAGRPVSARHPGLAERLVRRIRARPLRAFAGLWALILALLLMSAAWLGAGQLGRWERAEAAVGGGLILELKRSLEDVQGIPGIRWLMSDSLRDADRRLRSGPDDALFQVAGHLSRNEGAKALLACVTKLARTPNRDDPLLKRFLLAQLFHEGAGLLETSQAALMMAARLMVEQPDLTREAVVWSAPLREGLELLVHAPACPPENRLYAISALSGCGIPSQVEGLMELALDAPIGNEEHRLSLYAVASILLRSRPAQLGPDELRPGRLESAMLDWMKLDHDPKRWSGLNETTRDTVLDYPWNQLLTGWFLYQRDRRALIQLDEFLAEWHGLSALSVSMLEATARAAGTRERLAQGPSEWNWDRLVAWVGQCISFGEPGLFEAAEDELEAEGPAGSDRLDLLRSAIEKNAPSKRQVEERILVDLDDDSLLGADCGAPSIPLPQEEVELAPDSQALGRWSFDSEAVQLSGWSTGVRGRCLDYEHDDAERERHYRLFAFGTSWIEFAFTVPEETRQSGLILNLKHLSASRTVLPDEGVVDLRITLDGEHEVATVLLREPGWFWHPFPLKSSWMTPGDHTLRISLEPRTTTVYWLQEARVEYAQPGSER